MTAGIVTHEPFSISLQLIVRAARDADLPCLEWFGSFAAHREILARMLRMQQQGDGLLLLAAIDEFPVAQVALDLEQRRAERVGRLWALRVFPFLQGKGIGSRLIAAAEQSLVEAGFAVAEIGAEKWNGAARRLFERLGYRVTRELREPYSYRTPQGDQVDAVSDQWMLEKPLPARGRGREEDSK
jgi:ribosomal protein S18 acetylase RimI-like enzyme